ncbi:unnamed protein product [Adineta steineri]|uniref:Uncharacterized protein n=1 Tax=Adineta steineri TaxID=433720 RepID=A0A814WWC9_9BILA|nr:unnamed protein product [Adineta steineri]
MDSRIKQVTAAQIDESILPEINLQSIWDEQFHIEYVLLPNNEWTAHALRFQPTASPLTLGCLNECLSDSILSNGVESEKQLPNVPSLSSSSKPSKR